MPQDDFITQVQKGRAMPHMLVLEHVSPATRLLEKRRQMFEVQEVLDAQKAGFDRKEEIFKRQEDGLKKKDLDLQESLIKFSKFLQENDSKISRAEKKEREEAALRQQKEAEIAELEQVLEGLKRNFDTVNDVVEKHLKYQRYLEAVVDEDSDLQEVGELLNRHATLVATNGDLKQQQKVNNEEMERVRADMNATVKRRTDEILNKNNQIALLKKELEALQLQAADLESMKNSALQTTSQNTLAYGQVIMSTENLYNRVKANSNISHPQHPGPLTQLDSIGNFVADCAHILRTLKRQTSSI